MSSWFKTKNQQIIQLDNCTSFWIQEFDTVNVFCKYEDCDWNIGEFASYEGASKYIEEIYEILTEAMVKCTEF